MVARAWTHQDEPGPPPVDSVRVDRGAWYREVPVLCVVDACLGTRNTLLDDGEPRASERIRNINGALREARASSDWHRRPAWWNGCP